MLSLEIRILIYFKVLNLVDDKRFKDSDNTVIVFNLCIYTSRKMSN